MENATPRSEEVSVTECAPAPWVVGAAPEPRGIDHLGPQVLAYSTAAAAAVAVAHAQGPTPTSHDDGHRLPPSHGAGASTLPELDGYEGLQGTRPASGS